MPNIPLPSRLRGRAWQLSGALGSVLAAISVCAGDGPATDRPAAPVAKGTRLLGIDVHESENRSYEDAMLAAKAAGVQVVSLSINWNSVELSPGNYSANPNFLAIANAYYPPRHVKVNLMLRPLDTNGRQVPADLKERKFNDPEMIARFNRFLDYVFTQIPNLELGCVAIGNEIDLGLGGKAGQWTEYTEFFAQAVKHIKLKHPTLQVGATAGFEGLVSRHRGQLDLLNQSSDVVLVTYYPLNPDFTVKDPAVVSADFSAVTKAYLGKPVFFAEAGYPSSPVNGSSLEKQRQFVREVFQAWDSHPTQIECVMFSWLTDIAPGKVQDFKKYYGLGDPKFLAYLSSLGLRTYPGAGKDKPAFETLKTEAHLRGW